MIVFTTIILMLPSNSCKQLHNAWFPLPVLRYVVYGVALVTVERHTVKPPNKRHVDISSILFLIEFSNCFTQDGEWICRRSDFPWVGCLYTLMYLCMYTSIWNSLALPHPLYTNHYIGKSGLGTIVYLTCSGGMLQ